MKASEKAIKEALIWSSKHGFYQQTLAELVSKNISFQSRLLNKAVSQCNLKRQISARFIEDPYLLQ